jgi:TRAP transporter 4TM/12TM fusion protein
MITLRTATSSMIRIAAIAASLYHLYVGFVGVQQPIHHRAIHLAFILFIAFLIQNTTKDPKVSKVRIISNYICSLLAVGVAVYVSLNIERITTRFPLADTFTNFDMVFGVALLLLVLEMTRRTIGWPLVLICLTLLLYAFLGPYIPGVMYHSGYSISRIVEYMFFTMEGIYGMPIAVASTYVYLFVLFGVFLSKSGGGDFLIDVARAIAGKASGGPAKVAIFASGFMGMISGSAVGNVVTTGTITIPMMKRAGFKPVFAGAVEAVASTGGQIMPPLMGVAAFLLAEVTGIPYSQVAISSLFPAILYFLSLYMVIHFSSKKQNIKAQTDDIPNIWPVLRKGWQFLLPPVVLIYLLIRGYPLIQIALWTIILTWLVSYVRSNTRMSISKILDALESGARSAIIVSTACAAAGIVIGGISLTAVGGKLISIVASQAHLSIIFTLVFTMIVCIVLGMGMPAPAAYLITAVLTAPILVSLGLPLLPAHLFCLYFAIISFITPPVAVAAYAAAGISGGDLSMTGWTALRLGLCGFIIPFAFVYKPSLLLLSSWPDVLFGSVTAILGVLCITAGITGYFIRNINTLIERALCILGGILLFVYPHWLGAVVGFSVSMPILISPIIKRRFSLKKIF